MTHRKPTKAEIQAAEGAHVEDVIAPNLRILFCGINPGLYSGAVGYHFARPGNRFWPTLYRAGFTDRILAAHEQSELLALGYGITNFIERATATAKELRTEEFLQGRERLAEKVRRYCPAYVAILGIGAFRKAFGRGVVALGLQDERWNGSRLWLLPNPSGLNAHYQLDDLARLFGALRQAAQNSEI